MRDDDYDQRAYPDILEALYGFPDRYQLLISTGQPIQWSDHRWFVTR